MSETKSVDSLVNEFWEKTTAGGRTEAFPTALTFDDILLVPAGGERQWLAPWPVEVLPGVGPIWQYSRRQDRWRSLQ